MVFTSFKRAESNVLGEDRYPALRGVLLIWKVLVVLQALATIAIAVFSWVGTKDPNRAALGLLFILGGSVIALIQWALAEFVEVVMDIEENTRRLAEKA